MRRPLGYALSVVTGYLVARHLHAVDVRWSWYAAGPEGAGDDPLALIAWMATTTLGVIVVRGTGR